MTAPRLRDYQDLGIKLIGEEIVKRKRKAICFVMGTGLGKTVVMSEICRRHVGKDPKHKVLWCVHREELVTQAFDELTNFGMQCGVIMASPSRTVNPYRNVQVASIQTMLARKLFLDGITLVVFDECFVAGTKVDNKSIESLQLGDIVRCVDHSTGEIVFRKVTRLFKSKPSGLVRVNGVICTPNHPFYVPGEGYVPASNLKGKYIVRNMWGHESSATQDLFKKMHERECVAHNDQNEPNTRSARIPSGSNDRFSESNDDRVCSESYVSHTPKDWSQTPDSGWERPTYDSSSTNVVGGTRFELEVRNDNSYEVSAGEGRYADSLQDRFGYGRIDATCRDRRLFSRSLGTPGTGQAKDGLAYLERVDSIEVLEPGSDGLFGGLCPDGYVYNFEVEEHHNYFVDGILVHNCHHAPSATWSAIPKTYIARGAIVLGATATPIRGDGIGLGEVYESIVQPISTKRAIERGFLTPYDFARPPYPLKNDEIAQAPVDAYLEHTPGEKAIVFAAHICAATEFLDGFTKAGIDAVMVTGKMNAEERRKKLDRYKSGQARVLVNVGIATEGFNDPPTSCVILARAIGSIGFYLQTIGRGLRLSPATGKKRLMIIDLHGSSHVHEEPDKEHDWQLEGEALKKPKQANPERFCAGCGVLLEGDATICDLCQEARPELVPPTVVNIKLVKYAAKLKEDPTKRAKYLARLIMEGQAKGYRYGAAYFKYKAVYGEAPPHDVVTLARQIVKTKRTDDSEQN